MDVKLDDDGSFVHITVRDYGHGIPEGELPHVKEKFYKGSSKNRGTGIGLSVCDEIVTRHGGRLDIDNAPGGGGRLRQPADEHLILLSIALSHLQRRTPGEKTTDPAVSALP